MHRNLLLQKLAPHQLLSRCAGYLARIEQPKIKNQFIRWLMQLYHIDLSEALQQDPTAYKSLNDFFLRSLQTDKRPIVQPAKAIASPVDGFVSQYGQITQGELIQAKGKHYSLYELLGANTDVTETFNNGAYMTLYLAPENYHWVHMPFNGKLTGMIYVPGKLFSVNQLTLQQVPKVFARNERVISTFDTECGPMAVILVGAMLVGNIHTVWHGDVNPTHSKKIHRWQYPNPKTASVEVARGEAMGHFKMGSTVIVLFSENTVKWNSQLQTDQAIKFGEQIGEVLTLNPQ